MKKTASVWHDNFMDLKGLPPIKKFGTECGKDRGFIFNLSATKDERLLSK
jgi:hypothetical protein